MLDEKTFDYLQPTAAQIEAMQQLRKAAHTYSNYLVTYLPDGPDKTYALRKLREVAMWANIAITRHADGSPRTDGHGVRPDYPLNHPAPGDLGSVPT